MPGIPIGHGVLRAELMRDVGIVANRIPRGHGGAQFGQTYADLWAEDDTVRATLVPPVESSKTPSATPC